MIINNYQEPKSSFLSMQKDLSLIVNMILKNNNLKKLLYYTTADPLSMPKLTEDQSLSLFGKQIKIVPKVYIDADVLAYIIISFDNFMTNATNPQFRDNLLSFDIICHFDQWQMKDMQLRPYRIAAELDGMFNDKKLTGIGTLQFVSCNQAILSDEFAMISLNYQAIHGGEDKKFAPTPEQEQQNIINFNEIYNNR